MIIDIVYKHRKDIKDKTDNHLQKRNKAVDHYHAE